MGYKGSVVVKKTHLLNMIQNQKKIFRSNIADDSKWHVWGRQISYETILENDISDYNWNRFMQEAFAFRPSNMSDGIDWVFSELS